MPRSTPFFFPVSSCFPPSLSHVTPLIALFVYTTGTLTANTKGQYLLWPTACSNLCLEKLFVGRLFDLVRAKPFSVGLLRDRCGRCVPTLCFVFFPSRCSQKYTFELTHPKHGKGVVWVVECQGETTSTCKVYIRKQQLLLYVYL